MCMEWYHNARQEGDVVGTDRRCASCGIVYTSSNPHTCNSQTRLDCMRQLLNHKRKPHSHMRAKPELALHCIDQLALEPSLRAALGLALRRSPAIFPSASSSAAAPSVTSSPPQTSYSPSSPSSFSPSPTTPSPSPPTTPPPSPLYARLRAMGDTLRQRVVCDTTVRQLCLTSCLSDAHRAAVLDTLSPMVLDHHTARAWASDLLNTHLTCVGEQVLDEMKVWGTSPPPAPSQVDQVLKSIEQHAFRGFELNDTAIYQALVLVCKEPAKRQPNSLHQRAKRHNPLAETDCWSVMSTYKRWLEELLGQHPHLRPSLEHSNVPYKTIVYRAANQLYTNLQRLMRGFGRKHSHWIHLMLEQQEPQQPAESPEGDDAITWQDRGTIKRLKEHIKDRLFIFGDVDDDDPNPPTEPTQLAGRLSGVSQSVEAFMESLKASSQLLLDHELQSRARREQQQRQQQQQPSPPPANDPQPQQPQPQPPPVSSAAVRTQLDAYLAAAAKIADIIARFYRPLELRCRRPKKKQEATKASSSDPPSDPASDDDSSSASTEDISSSWDLRWRIPWLVYLNKETLRLLQARPRRHTARRRRSQRRLQRQNRRRKTRMRKRKPKRKDNHDNNDQRGSGSSPRQPQLLQSDHSRAVPLARLGAASATEKRQHRRSMAAQKAALRKRQKANADEWKRVLQRRKGRERDEEKKEEGKEEKPMDPTASTAATAANEVEEQSRRTQSGFRLFPVIPLVPGHVILPLESVKALYSPLHSLTLSPTHSLTHILTHPSPLCSLSCPPLLCRISTSDSRNSAGKPARRTTPTTPINRCSTSPPPSGTTSPS